MAWLGIWLSSSNTCDGVWSNGVEQNRETDKEHGKDCVEDGFQLARVKYDMDGEEGREVLIVVSIVVSIFERDQNWN